MDQNAQVEEEIVNLIGNGSVIEIDLLWFCLFEFFGRRKLEFDPDRRNSTGISIGNEKFRRKPNEGR